ncbi:YsnF/AvaK domain-containing protein [Kitasatospora sp. NPDC059812]|uniref:YsnF/AvaK domain-containing protein n=2 Tax=Kitasatosporales TaxID=85011 RepID=UPI003662706D
MGRDGDRPAGRDADRPISREDDRPARPDLDFGTTSAAEPVKPITFHSLAPAPTTTPADPTGTATEVNVRTLNTPAPAAAPTTIEPKPQPAPVVTTTATTNSVMAAPVSERSTGPATSPPNGPVEITCREERLDITTDWHIVGTAKLRKYVTSEQVERRVPVVRERVRVERMPVSEAERASLTEKEIAEAVEEVTLREERPVVRKYLTPIERVRLVVERYTAEEVIRDELRREHVEVHDNTAAAPATPAATPVAETPRPAVLRPFA